ncbi:MAG: S41 family peptidase, partial [Planctomycetes bacterium]|nr:S41 family peptidase [Planctomycetota bacterium]
MLRGLMVSALSMVFVCVLLLVSLCQTTCLAAEKVKRAPSTIAASIGYLLDRFYYDHDRFHAETMVHRAIRAMETAEMSLEVSWDGKEIRCNFNGDEVLIPAKKPQDIFEAMALFTLVQTYIEDRKEYSDEQMADITYAMLNGALQTLDPHTVLFPPRPASNFREDLAGEFFGIGAYLNHDDGIVIIDRVMPGNPADRAGLLGGDKIMKVNGEKTEGLSLSETVQRIKGKSGTKVVLGIEREGEEELLAIEVTRGLVKIQILQSYRDGEIAYVRLDEFNSNADTMLREVLQKWDRDMDNPVMGLVLDMRFNGGGRLDKAKIISDMFLGAGKEIVRTVDKEGKPHISKSNQNNISILDVPMIVLLSPSSASATEIVSGALQQNNRAVILGSTSYGKGSVQQYRTLNNDSLFTL